MDYIKKFQIDNNLVPDGIIGRMTLLKMKEVFKISSNSKTAHFVGQLHHETRGFTKGVESLNYSVEGLKKTFSFYRRHPQIAQGHGRISGVQKANQQAIGNNVYSDTNRSSRYKLGNTFPGDGFRYRGRGAIMITGKSNYTSFYRWCGLPGTTNPKLVERKYFWRAAIWYFEVNRIWDYCSDLSEDSIRKVTKKINGGDNGLKDRIHLSQKYYDLLNKNTPRLL